MNRSYQHNPFFMQRNIRGKRHYVSLSKILWWQVQICCGHDESGIERANAFTALDCVCFGVNLLSMFFSSRTGCHLQNGSAGVVLPLTTSIM